MLNFCENRLIFLIEKTSEELVSISQESIKDQENKIRNRESILGTAKEQVKTRELLKKAGGALSEDVSRNLSSKIERSQKKEQLEEVQTEINDRIDTFRQWRTQIHGFEDIFATDQNEGTTFNQHAEKFKNMSVLEQEDVLRNLGKFINNYSQQFQELYEVFGSKNEVPNDIEASFKAVGRTKRKELLKELKTTNKQFQQIQRLDGYQKLSKKQQKSIDQVFRELGIEGRKAELKRLSETLKLSELDKDFDQLAELNKAANLDLPNTETFTLLTQRAKAETIGKAKQKLIAGILKTYSPYFSQMGRKDQDVFKVHLRKDPIISLAYYFNNADDYIGKVKETTKYLEKNNVDKETLTHFDWDNLYTFERHQLVQKGTLEKYQNTEHLKQDQDYDKKLAKYQEYKGFGYVNKKGLQAYKEWFRNLTIEEKKAINANPKKDYLDQTLPARKANVDKFTALPEPIQKEYSTKFAKGDFEERTRMIVDIEAEYSSLSEKFATKLDQKIKDRLFSPKSKASYLAWFQTENSLKAMTKFLKLSDLDNKQRVQIRDLWDKIKTTDKFNELPTSKQKKLELEFIDSDLETRTKFIETQGKEFYDNPAQGLSIEDELKAIKLDNKSNLNQLSEIEAQKEEFTDIAETALITADYATARIFFAKALELTNPDTDAKEIKDLKQKIEEAKELQQLIEGNESETPLIAQIDKAIEDELGSPKIKDQMTYQTILYMAYISTKTSERQTQSTSVNERQHQSLKAKEGTQISDLDTSIKETTNDKLHIDQTDDGKLYLSETRGFKADNFTEKSNTNYDQDMVNHFARMQKLNPEEQRDDSLQLVNDKNQEITADQFYNTVLAKNEQAITNQIADNITSKLGAKFETPALKKAFRGLVTKRLDILPDHMFTTTLEEQK